jgi:hypothetical protein
MIYIVWIYRCYLSNVIELFDWHEAHKIWICIVIVLWFFLLAVLRDYANGEFAFHWRRVVAYRKEAERIIRLFWLSIKIRYVMYELPCKQQWPGICDWNTFEAPKVVFMNGSKHYVFGDLRRL